MHFQRSANDYKRDLDILGHAIDDAAQYLALTQNISFEDAKQFVKSHIRPNGPNALNDPKLLTLKRDEHQDRQKTVVPLSQFLNEVNTQRQMLSPSMMTYCHPDVTTSLTSLYIVEKIDQRLQIKKEGQIAKQKGNKNLATIKKKMEKSSKTKINALSGAHSSHYNPLWLKSAHTTLTAACRTFTSYSNANSERFTQGMRHYATAEIALANILSIVNDSDYDAIEKTMAYYQLNYPSANDVWHVVHRSARHYWKNDQAVLQIKHLIDALNPLQRAAYVYTQDLYHLMRLNTQFVHTFISELTFKADTPINDAATQLARLDNDTRIYVSYLCAQQLQGTTLDDLKIDDPIAYGIVGATAEHLNQVLSHYQLLFDTFWKTHHLPPNIAHFTDALRSCVIVSDTDSTIFTVQDWIHWYTGSYTYTPRAMRVYTAMVYLTSQTTAHLLAQLSAQMGVVAEKRFKLQMKNEFLFPVLGVTPRAKHYFSYILACEGNVYDTMETEYKGRSLHNSNIPRHVMQKLDQFIRNSMNTVLQGEKVALYTMADQLSALEKDIINSVKAGRYDYLPVMQIKDRGSYKSDTSSNYGHYALWNNIFGEKYGVTEAPPYMAVKLSLTADTPQRLKRWLDTLEDREIAHKFTQTLLAQNRQYITQFLLPLPIIQQTGIPQELIAGADIRKIVYLTVEAFYLILETYGFYLHEDSHARLVSDQIHRNTS